MIRRREFMKISIGLVQAATWLPDLEACLPALTLLRQVTR
jgi:hypothetical protein